MRDRIPEAVGSDIGNRTPPVASRVSQCLIIEVDIMRRC